jgi:uncharacterized protein (TIGR03382 family)
VAAELTRPEAVLAIHEGYEVGTTVPGGASMGVRDAWGVDWHATQLRELGPGGGTVILLTVAPTSARTYTPTPVLGVELLPGHPADAAPAIEIAGEYAAIHADEVALLVRAGAEGGVPWWVWGMLGLAVLSRRR